MLVDLTCSESLKKLLEDLSRYKELMNTKISETPIEVETIIDKIYFIIFTYQNLENLELKHQLKEIIENSRKKVSNELMQIFNNETSKLTIGKDDVETEFERSITELYEKSKKTNSKVKAYQTILDGLELKNDSEIAKDIRTMREAINIFYLSDKNRLNEELKNILTNYINNIKEIILNNNIENNPSAEEIELNLRKELQPLLVEIQHLSPKMICRNKLIEELENSLKCFYEEEAKTYNGAILETIIEIKETLENKFISKDIKIEIQRLVESCMEKWYNEFITNGYQILENKNILEPETSENIRFELLVLKDLLTIKLNVENYIKESLEYSEISNLVI